MAVEELTLQIEVTSEDGSYSPWWLIQGTAKGLASWLRRKHSKSGAVNKIKYTGVGADGATPLFTALVRHDG